MTEPKPSKEDTIADYRVSINGKKVSVHRISDGAHVVDHTIAVPYNTLPPEEQAGYVEYIKELTYEYLNPKPPAQVQQDLKDDLKDLIPHLATAAALYDVTTDNRPIPALTHNLIMRLDMLQQSVLYDIAHPAWHTRNIIESFLALCYVTESVANCAMYKAYGLKDYMDIQHAFYAIPDPSRSLGLQLMDRFRAEQIQEIDDQAEEEAQKLLNPTNDPAMGQPPYLPSKHFREALAYPYAEARRNVRIANMPKKQDRFGIGEDLIEGHAEKVLKLCHKLVHTTPSIITSKLTEQVRAQYAMRLVADSVTYGWEAFWNLKERLSAFGLEIPEHLEKKPDVDSK